jgi:mannose-6-phosphate isomerase-like protein (cupin superfamily)
MVRRENQMEKDVRQRMRDGKGEVEILHIFKQDELQGKARLMARITLNKDCSIGPHEHHQEEEIFYIVKGKGTVVDNEEEIQVGPGDAVLTEAGTSHSIRNDGEEPLQLVAVILLYD